MSGKISRAVRWLLNPGRVVGRLAALVLLRAGQSALSEGEYGRAERRFQLAVRIVERMLGPTDVMLGSVLNDLGLVHKYQRRFDEAQRAFGRASAIMLAARGEVARAIGPYTAADAAALAAILDRQGKRAEAEALFRRSLTVFERIYGAEHYEVAVSLNGLGALCQANGDTGEAEELYKRALAIKERRLGGDHPDVATTLNNLAGLYRSRGRHADAEPLSRRALTIFERTLGPNHPSTMACREHHGALVARAQ